MKIYFAFVLSSALFLITRVIIAYIIKVIPYSVLLIRPSINNEFRNIILVLA